ncbi:MAG: hypothetical protein JO185_19140 [Acidobacteriaceae bacterium]|nr:hypothetical protein [Acidobacteriaceae bacterium]
MASVSFSTLPDFDNLMHPAHIQNPFPLYNWLRAHSPVHWNQFIGTWMLTRFEDVRAALADPLGFSSDNGEPLLERQRGCPPRRRPASRSAIASFISRSKASTRQPTPRNEP